MRIALVVAVALAGFMQASAALAAPMCLGHEATIVGTPGSEILHGTAHRDVIVAKAGHDLVFAHGGNDLVCTGRGRDDISLGPGADKARAGRGADGVSGNRDGADLLDGGAGAHDECLRGETVLNCE